MEENLDDVVQSLIDKYGQHPFNPAFVMVGDKDPTAPAAYFRENGADRVVTYGELVAESGRWAHYLREHGIEAGTRVAGFLPKGPALLSLVLAVWRLGAVYVPLFTAFGAEAVSYRLNHSGTALVVTTQELAARMGTGAGAAVVTVDAVQEALGRQAVHEWVPRNPQDPVILIYTSGTTGQPKGVPMPLRMLSVVEAYMRWGLDLQPEDRYWNLADPGWAYGLAFALIGPWLLGQANHWFEQPFRPDAALEWMSHWGITHFAAAPTAYRAIRAQGLTLPASVRALSSAGEPLNPSINAWAEETVGVPILDHYGQTEAGMPINNHRAPALRGPVKPGSMGRSMPGMRAVVLDDEGRELPPGHDGHLAIDVAHSPLFSFTGYWRDPEATRARFTQDGRYYLTGDEASQDQDGYFFFTSRSDDVILTAGYRVGPFEVESVLSTHPAVAETAVVGVPDTLRGQAIKAYVVLRPGYEPSPALESDLQNLVRNQFAKTAYPRQIAFVSSLPKTPSGKVQRFLLRAEDEPGSA